MKTHKQSELRNLFGFFLLLLKNSRLINNQLQLILSSALFLLSGHEIGSRTVCLHFVKREFELEKNEIKYKSKLKTIRGIIIAHIMPHTFTLDLMLYEVMESEIF